jgi:hypothetical protein
MEWNIEKPIYLCNEAELPTRPTLSASLDTITLLAILASVLVHSFSQSRLIRQSILRLTTQTRQVLLLPDGLSLLFSVARRSTCRVPTSPLGTPQSTNSG